jgi:hypothetical protein
MAIICFKYYSNTPIRKVCDAVRNKCCKYEKSTTVNLKTGDGQYAKTKRDIAETLAQTFEKNSSSNNYSNEFQQHKCKAEKEHINFTSTNDEDYNSLVSIDDLINLIKIAKDSAAGPDKIYYKFLKHFPP